jgi:putative aldouronate transport system permease protein
MTQAARVQKKPRGFITEIKKNWMLYAMTVPGIFFFLIFSYIPMGGLVMAFQNFNLVKGIFGSEFGGLNNFKFLFADGTRQTVLKVIGNTLYLNVLFIIASTIVSIALAVIFNEIRNKKVKKVTQTLSILPYFVSWAVIALFLEGFLKADGGMLSTFLTSHGINISFYSDPSPWRIILVIMKIWQGAGYGAIVYIATITGMDPGIYEAAEIDGASRWQQILHLTLPMLKPTIILMTLFSVGRIFYGDFGMIYGLVQDNSLLFSATDVIDTYVYRMLRQLNNYGMSTAVGLIQSVFGFLFVYFANKLARRFEPGSAIF